MIEHRPGLPALPAAGTIITATGFALAIFGLHRDRQPAVIRPIL